MSEPRSPHYEERADDIWERYTLRNQSQQQIANDLGISQQRVSQILTDIRAALPDETRHDCIARRRAQLDALIAAHLPEARAGDKDATASLLKLLDREAKYMGLDAPQEVRATVTQTSPEVLERIRQAKAQNES